SLRITFEGGQWPGLETDRIPADWSDYQSFHADVTVREPSLIGFQVLQEKSSTGRGWDAGVTRWVKTEFLRPGTTTVSAPLHPNDWTALRPELGRNLAFRVFLYRPRAGQVLFLDRVRLSTTPAAVEKPRTEFTVLGTREKVENVQELDRRWKERWRVPTPTSVEAVEAAFRARLEELRRTHPDTMLSLLRDGETGWDPARPERVYDGWRDAYWSSHGPDALTEDRAENRGAAATHEVFMRHRSPLMRVELGSIPPGSEILHAELLLVRSTDIYEAERHPQRNPNMWVAEACNRPWVEQEVNAYEYARGKFWRAVGGMDWAGPNPDFLPLYLAHGPGNGRVTTWDFTEAVRFWTAGRNPNHGFMLHCDANDWLQSAWTREAPIRRNRPALLVLYRPARR
ncbi:MAG: DNRLRE domain-containing protein, partial [Armatimonadetes bacterium]|nr:DNRLRE domain-containing protein [Armatimonadota bacterium]